MRSALDPRLSRPARLALAAAVVSALAIACAPDASETSPEDEGTGLASEALYGAENDGLCHSSKLASGCTLSSFGAHDYARCDSATTTMTWAQAAAACDSLDGTLVNIDDASEQAFVTKLAGSLRVFVGGRRRDAHNWVWSDQRIFANGSDGSAYDGAYVRWATGEPLATAVTGSGTMLDSGGWRTITATATARASFVCELPGRTCSGIETGGLSECANAIDDDTDGRADCADSGCGTDELCVMRSLTEISCTDGRDGTDADGAPDCEDSECTADPACARCARARSRDCTEVTVGGVVFRVCPATTWARARDACTAEGYQLATLDTPEERAAIGALVDTRIISRFPTHRPFGVWTGPNDRAREGTWRTVTGGTLPAGAVWASEQPASTPRDADCASVDSAGNLRATRCMYRLPYVCEPRWPLCAAPSISAQPADATVIEGGEAVFEVLAHGTGPLLYQWQRNGAPMGGENARRLRLPAVSLADDGARFNVVVNNAYGFVASAEATLHVQLAAPVYVSGPEPVEVWEGQSASFSVVATGTALAYQWRRDGAPLADAFGPTLELATVSRSDDQARFDCVVSNAAGSFTSPGARLSVRETAHIVTQPVSLAVTEGALATFTVAAEGEAPLVYQWRRSGAAIPGAVLPSYTLDPATLADSGAVFTVVVSNGGGSVVSAPATLTVTRAPPVLVTPLADTTVAEGTTARFEVLVAGVGLRYRWERNGVEIAGAITSSYVTPTTAYAHDGTQYRVIVSNEGGSVSSTATLHVAPNAPVITAEPADVSVLEGQGASFEVTALGSALSYQWERDGVAIAGATTRTLSLASLARADDGATFRCIVTNPAGSVASRAARLSVGLRPPVITAQSLRRTADEGQLVSFYVTASGSELSYQWRRGEAPILGADASTYQLTATADDDGAIFTCVVSNPAGSATSQPMELLVALRPPTIATAPSDVVVDEGASATFGVVAGGSHLSYQWRRDGTPIPGATSTAYTLSPARWEDRGARFDVVVTNSAGSATSTAATLGVRLAPPRIDVGPTPVSVIEGQQAVFDVIASGSELVFEWLRDGELVPGASAPTLSLASAAIADDGARFVARVRNAAGSVESGPALLTVTPAAPVLTSAPADLTVDEGAAASFTVAVTGSLLTYRWERDGVVIAGATGPTLSLPTTTLADGGARFRVTATNPSGSVSAEAVLTVRQLPPRITAQPASLTVDEGQSASFTVGAEGSGLRFRWQRDGVDLPGETAATLSIASARRADDGAHFRAIVSNDAGSVTSAAATLGVRLLPPVIVTGPSSQTVTEGALAHFSVEATGSELSYAWTLDGAPIAGATSATLELGPVTLDRDGAQIRAVVSNAAGSVSSAPASLEVERVSPEITLQPASVTIDEGATATFALVALRADSYQWRRNGAPIPGATSPSVAIPAVTLADDGARFDCVVTNAAGSITSDVATLTVRMLAPRILEQPADLALVEGQDGSLTVVAEGSALAYQWRRGGTPIAGATAASLALSAVSLADDGATFDVLVTNAAGSVASRVATLDVALAAPVITSQPSALDVLEGAAPSFHVEARGSLLSYRWQRDGVDIAGATASTLVLPPATLADHGARFAVVVSNAAGAVTSESALLQVRIAPPRITAQPVELTVDEGAPASFTLVAEGTHLVYQWRRDGEAIPGAVLATYTVPATPLAYDGARFDCIVSNEAGSLGSSSALLHVRMLPPVVVTSPASVTVDEGGDATFHVEATGSFRTYQWERDGAPIPGATSDTLVLSDVSVTDDGAQLRAIVTNAAGSVASNAATLGVRPLPPRITAQPLSRAVIEGSSVSFAVTASGAGPLVYQWSRDGAAIPGAVLATLTLEEATLADHGARFTVAVSNVSGTVVSDEAVLSVTRAAPVLLSGLTDVSVVEGAAARFEVVASGVALTYRWERDGALVAGATTARLELASASASDDGAVYRVVVSNEGGSVESSATLHVSLAAPTITVQPADATVLEGEGARFELAASGTALRYQWERNGVPIAGATASLLVLGALSRADDGATFRCVVTNDGGSVTSRAALLRVSLRPPVLTASPTSVTALEGSAASFHVAATGNELAYAWYRDGALVAGASSDTLTLPSVSPLDDGARFHAVVSNDAGSVTSAEATLTVTLRAPVITSSPLDFTADEGGTTTFVVVAEGSSLSYQWRRDGVAIAGATSSTLTIEPVLWADRGARFDCVVTNAAGSVTSAEAVLAVTLGAPRITSAPLPASVLEGDAARFDVVAAGSELSYAWLRDGVLVAGASAPTLSLASVRAEDDGASFVARVSNAAGSVDSAPVLLRVALRAPVLATALSDLAVDEGAAASLTVVVTGSQLTYAWERDGVAIPGATSATYTLPVATLADDAARFRVVASNAAGSVSSEARLSVRLLPPRIVTAPASLTVDEGAPAAFVVVAEGSLLRFRWERDGVELPGETAPSLVLPHVSWADRGASFRAIVSNDAGSITSAPATLGVRLAPPMLLASPASQSVLEGETAHFRVEASGSELAYAWSVDGAPVAGATSATLDLGPVTLADDGAQIVATVTNAAGSVTSAVATLEVESAAPVFVLQPASATVDEGASVSFTVDALRADSYAWRRDGVAIPDATSPVLALPLVTLADDGARFDCIATGPAGSTTSAPATLTVRMLPPHISAQPADLSLVEGASGALSVVAEGSALRYQWQRDGVDVPGATTPTLALGAVTLADDGATFAVIVENAAGRVVSRTATLDVALAPPVITAEPTSVGVVEGGTATFHVAATGSLLSYQWQRDGADLPGETSATLTLTAATLAQSGARYRVLVRNDAATLTSAEAILTVTHAPPRITAEPADQSVDEGAPVTFTVVAAGSDLAYQWRRDGAAIPGAVLPAYSLAAASLADHDARFDCIVSNPAGSAGSVAARLTVRMLPPTIVAHPAALTVDEAADASFHVEARGSQLAYEWQRDGVAIEGATSPTLTLSSVALTDDGAQLRVIVRNAAGTVTSETARLTVRPLPPRITAQPLALTVTEGATASFSLTAAGHAPSYQWRRDGVAIPGATAPTLALASTLITDDGASFDCVVSNSSGSVTSQSAVLTVRAAAPRITSEPASLTVVEGSAASFTVVATGSHLSYQWHRAGAPIEGATAATFSLATVGPDDDGAIFRVVVSNETATVSSALATLTVTLAPPSITAQPTGLEAAEGAPFSLSVTASGSRLTYQWQRDGADLPGQNGASLSIPAATLGHAGAYRVRVSNATASVLSAIATVVVRPLPPVIDEQPATQIVPEGEPVSFRVVAHGTELTYQWLKDGFDIAGATAPTYAIAAASPASAGAYSVRVSNTGGVALSSEAVLTVRAPLPRITQQPADTQVDEGASATFTASAEGTGLSYRWQRFGIDVAGATAPTLTLPAVREEDDGASFHVVVSNESGSVVSHDAVLRVRDAQAPTLDVEGATTREVTTPFVVLRGSATDDRGAPTVELTSDRLATPLRATPTESGTYELEVPLALGVNALSLVALDAAGNHSPARTLSVTRELPSVPRLSITEPATGAVTETATTTVRGTVLTSLARDSLRVRVGELVAFVTGTDGSYAFVIEGVPLALGTNVLTATVESPVGDVSATTTVVRRSPGDPGDGGPGGAQPPAISLVSVQPDTYYAEDHPTIRGTVTAARCVAGVTVAGVAAHLVPAGAGASFEGTLTFGAATDLDVRVEAIDCDGLVSAVAFRAHLDSGAPIIQLPGYVDPPDVNPVLESPVRVSGTIRDPSLAGVAVGGMTLGLVPAGEPGLWSFTADLPLTRGEVRTLRIAAWDRAGHSAEREVRLRLDAQAELALVSPTAGDRVLVSGASGDITVRARVSSLAPTDVVVATLDGGAEQSLSVAGALAEGVLSGVAADASHTLRVQVRGASGDVLAQATATFEVVDRESVPLQIVAIEPANEASLVEPNAFVRVAFNRPVDPALVHVALVETVHGRAYRQPEEGIDIRDMSVVELVDVDHEREPVTVNAVALPGETTVLAYPTRDLTYGADLEIDVVYDGHSLRRSRFTVRPLPTLLHGFVADHDYQPIPGIEVLFPALGLRAVSNGDGLWDMGFGWTADRTIPPGLHHAIVNPGMRNPAYGSLEIAVVVREGENNDAGVAALPYLDTTEPFRIVASGQSDVTLSRGDLRLDLTSSVLTFPDGATQGPVHAQMMPALAIGYRAGWPVEFGYSLQPTGIEVSGAVGFEVNIPLRNGTHEWVDGIGDRVLVFALDPRSATLVIVGVARVDAAADTMRAEGPLALARLDYLAFAQVPLEAQDLLARYARGEATLTQLRASFEPPHAE